MKKTKLKVIGFISVLSSPFILTPTIYNLNSLERIDAIEYNSEISTISDSSQKIVNMKVVGLKPQYKLGDVVSFTVQPVMNFGDPPSDIKWTVHIFYEEDTVPTSTQNFLQGTNKVNYQPQFKGTFRVGVLASLNGIEIASEKLFDFVVKEQLDEEEIETFKPIKLDWWVYLVIALSSMCLIALVIITIVSSTKKKKNVNKKTSKTSKIDKIKQSPSDNVKMIGTTQSSDNNQSTAKQQSEKEIKSEK